MTRASAETDDEHPLHTLSNILELELRAGAARLRLVGDAALGARRLEALLVRVAAREAGAVEALVACALVLTRDAALAGALARAASAEARGWLGVFLRDAPPSRSLLPRAQLPDPRASAGTLMAALHDDFGPSYVLPRSDPTDPHQPLVLGWQRTDWPLYVRRRVVTEPVLAHRDPELAARFLVARHTALVDVLRMAARRPTTPALLSAVATSARWMARGEVREALAKNPFLPTRVALLILPTVSRSAWTELAGVSRAHPLVREVARALLAGRLPNE